MSERTKLGVAKLDISPDEPLPLSGFGGRKGKFEGVSHRLYMRVFLFEQNNGSRVLLVEADIIMWAGERMEGLLSRLRERFGIDERSVILSASHTHGGPQTSALMLPVVGVHHPEYTLLLEDRLFQGIEQAIGRLEPVTIECGQGECSVGIHRRKYVDGRMTMAPNPDTPIDREVTVIRFRGEDETTIGVLFHYTCHPTTTSDNLLTSDYSGVAMESVEQSLGEGAVAAFLQGCCGDIRPALIRDGRFYSGHDEDVHRIGGSYRTRCCAFSPLRCSSSLSFHSEPPVRKPICLTGSCRPSRS
jgi:hypothetical protein